MGAWSKLETKEHINGLELKAANFAILTFTKIFPQTKIIDLQMDNIAALSYIAKMEGTHNRVFSDQAKETWNSLLANGIIITVEYLLGKLNMEVDHQSRSVTDSSDWKLNPIIFKKICKVFWTPDIDIFASRISH